MALLADAYGYAEDTRCDLWEYAVEIDTLMAEGLGPNDFRWLLRKGYVEHARETTKPGADRRRFCRCQGTTFGKRSCFTPTDAGLALARRMADASAASAVGAILRAAWDDPDDGKPPHPHWNATLRELSVAGRLIKRFTSPAPNQETVLATFEEEGWPSRIDDPLPQQPCHDPLPKRRLNDTVKGLNRHHKIHLVRFSCDGTGEGVRWEWVDDVPINGGEWSDVGNERP